VLDPIFSLVQVQEPQFQKKSRASRWKVSWLIRMKAVYEELRVWILSQRLSAPLQKIYGKMKAARNSRRTFGARPLSQGLPKEANLKLIQSFERLKAAGLPMLVITAQSTNLESNPEAFRSLLLREMHRDGREVTIEITGTPVFSRDESFFGYYGFARDVTSENPPAAAHPSCMPGYRSVLDRAGEDQTGRVKPWTKQV